MTDNSLKTVAENKIKSLETEISSLEGELKSMESFNSAAWAEYGSELCGGEMSANEQKIRVKISNAMGKVILLRNFIKGNVDISEEDYLKDECSRHDVEIGKLNELKNSINARLDVITAVKNLLGI